MKRFLSLLLLVVVLAPSALAQVSRGDIEVGVDVGAVKFDSNVSDDTEPLAGLRAGWFLTDAFALELEARRAEVILNGEFQTVMLNAQYNFNSRSTVNPYVFAGLGGANAEYEVLGVTVDDSSLAVSAGAGARIFFAGGWALRLQAGVLSEETFDERSTHGVFTAGVSYRFSR
ncbi:MAG TPA: porin family protein [Thermoanaerobaculia bacterium]